MILEIYIDCLDYESREGKGRFDDTFTSSGRRKHKSSNRTGYDETRHCGSKQGKVILEGKHVLITL